MCCRDYEKEICLLCKLEKCNFFTSEIEYLGHKMSGDGTSYKINEKLLQMERPNNVKELQRFLGTENSFRKFIPVFSRIAHPLYKLLRKNNEFIRDKNCEIAFQTLEDSLFSDVVLAHPNYELPFYLFTDASDLGLGTSLMQQDEDVDLRPIAVFSKSSNSAQQMYSATKKEIPAIYESLKKFRFLILGYDVTVMSDHRPLYFSFRKSFQLTQQWQGGVWKSRLLTLLSNILKEKGTSPPMPLSRIQSKPLSVKDIENLVDKEDEAMMVTMRSATGKLNLKDIEYLRVSSSESYKKMLK